MTQGLGLDPSVHIGLFPGVASDAPSEPGAHGRPGIVQRRPSAHSVPCFFSRGGRARIGAIMEERFLATRRTLLHRLRNVDDHAGWREFFEIYWRLIYAVAKRSGLDEFEAEEVVQETVITAARKIPEFRYDPAIGSFRGWLLTIARWRIADQFRKRQIEEPARTDQIAELAVTNFDAVWAEEWERHLLGSGLEILKRQD